MAFTFSEFNREILPLRGSPNLPRRAAARVRAGPQSPRGLNGRPAPKGQKAAEVGSLDGGPFCITEWPGPCVISTGKASASLSMGQVGSVAFCG